MGHQINGFYLTLLVGYRISHKHLSGGGRTGPAHLGGAPGVGDGGCNQRLVGAAVYISSQYTGIYNRHHTPAPLFLTFTEKKGDTPS